jgi:hypothetical protein
MRHALFALSLALFVALAPAPRASARGSAVAGDWAAVQAIAPGAKLVVRTKDGERLNGIFEHATDLVLVVERGGKQVAIERERIRRVQLDRGKSRLKGMLFGAAVGAGAGFGVGGAIYFPHRDDIVGVLVPATTALGAGIGAGIGAALGKGNKNVTIYEAP